jgi:hypothetical protein
MPKEGLKHLFVLSEGSFVNGSSLIKGLEHKIEDAQSLVECAVMMPDLRKQWHRTKKILKKERLF